jgi:predicted MFS family arabinose efflux permease
VFGLFAAAWVVPSMVGPSVAALVAHAWSWRWVFLGVVGLVAASTLLILPALRGLETRDAGASPSRARLAWAVVGAVAVLALELLGSASGVAGLGALGAFVLVVLALTRLLPPGSLTGRPGLPAVIATRGLMSAGFFCAEAYIVYVLQEQWGLTPGRAGLALSVVGVTWALSSQLQARLGERVSHVRAMEVGSLLGYSAILIASALPPRGRLTCLEANGYLAKFVKSNLERAGLGKKAKVVVGDAVRVIPLLPGRFDFVLIDAVKEDYLEYLRQLEPKLVAGAVVVADNTGVFRRDVAPYLAYVRDPAGPWQSREYDLGDDCMEVSIRS